MYVCGINRKKILSKLEEKASRLNNHEIVMNNYEIGQVRIQYCQPIPVFD